MDAYVEELKLAGIKVSQVGQSLIARDDAGIFSLLIIQPMRSDRYKAFLKGGIELSAEADIHQAMDSLTGKGGNKVSRAVYIAINRDTFDQTPLVIEPSQKRLDFFNDMLIASDCEELPQGVDDHTCNWCDNRYICNGEDWPEITCGTCANVSVNNGILECPFGDSPCGKHLYHPQLMALKGYDLKSADQQKLRLDYGGVINSTVGDSVGMTSEELRKCQ